MKIDKLASVFAVKYKVAADAVAIEASLRSKINSLSHIVNKTYNVLRACAEAAPGKPGNDHEKSAMAGFKFCQQLVSIIDYLHIHQKEMPLADLNQAVKEMVSLIANNKDKSPQQFPHVSELIFQMVPVKTQHERKLRDELFGKARTGLSRLLSIGIDMIKELNVLSGNNSPTPARFSPNRAPLSVYDIVDFIRQHGDKFHLSGMEDWAQVMQDDPDMKERMTTVINAINRGHMPVDGSDAAMQIAEILKNHEERKSSNAPHFEAETPEEKL